MKYKKFLSLVFCMTMMLSVHAQTVKVKKEPSRVKGENTDGHAAELQGNAAEVNAALLRYFKTVGKVKQTEGTYLLTESAIHGGNGKIPVYAMVKDKGTSSVAWIGIKASEWPEASVEKINQELTKMIYEFGVKFYRDKIQVQVDESVQALQAVDKQRERLANDHRNLTMKLENNEKEKLRLEKALENNKLEHEDLLKRIERNKHDQDSVTVVAGQIQKVVEANRERQAKVK